MVEIVAAEAASEGSPLTARERTWLRSERPTVPPESLERFRRLVRQVLARETEQGKASDPRSFNQAVEWAGDQEYPLVVELAEGAFGVSRPETPLWKDRLYLVATAVALVVGMVLLVGILGMFGLLD